MLMINFDHLKLLFVSSWLKSWWKEKLSHLNHHTGVIYKYIRPLCQTLSKTFGLGIYRNIALVSNSSSSEWENSNYFNNFFTSVSVKINKDIFKSKKTHLSYLSPENNNTISLSPTLPEDMEDLISSMKTNKASGSNSIPTKILNLFKKEFSKPLSDVINLPFNQVIFPNLLKIANIISILRKGDKLDCNNYRPIFLLDNICKIYEKCIHTHLINYLWINKLFLSHQFSFCNGYSINLALTSFTGIIREALDEDKFACGFFIDLQKAFETVCDDILLSKRNYYGVRGPSH